MNGAFWAYQALGWVGLAAAVPGLVFRAIRDPRYRSGWSERFGRWGEVPVGGVWIHGASVGELRAAGPLVRAVRERGAAVVVTATSPAGRAEAGRMVGAAGTARLLPLDLAPLVGRALARVRPRALVLVETELWPALLWSARRRGVPVVVVNGRISDRAFPRYLRARRWLKPVLQTLGAVQAQSDEHAERFVALGVPPERVSTGGNLKFDLPEPDPADRVASALRTAAGPERQVVVAGSTHPGEARAVAEAAARLEARGIRCGLVVVPRHLERLAEAEAELRAAGREPVRWSALSGPLDAGLASAFAAGRAVVVDRYGLLSRLYGGAGCAFIGGTLVPVGGHNPLEALVWGVPVVFGPHTANIREVRREILERGLGAEAAGPGDLAAEMARFLAGGEAGREVAARTREFFRQHRGATNRALALLESLGAIPGSGNQGTETRGQDPCPALSPLNSDA